MAKVILLNVKPDDFILAIRAARWLISKPSRKDAILTYGDVKLDFYVKRNKSSITVRPCEWR